MPAGGKERAPEHAPAGRPHTAGKGICPPLKQQRSEHSLAIAILNLCLAFGATLAPQFPPVHLEQVLNQMPARHSTQISPPANFCSLLSAQQQRRLAPLACEREKLTNHLSRAADLGDTTSIDTLQQQQQQQRKVEREVSSRGNLPSLLARSHTFRREAHVIELKSACCD